MLESTGELYIRITLEKLKEQRKQLDELILLLETQIEMLHEDDDNVFERYLPPVA